MQTPSLVASQVQLPQQRFTLHMTMPFQVQQQLQSPLASMLQRFCRVAAATLSSHLQWILKPPAHFSKVILQRGTTHQLAGTVVGAAGVAVVVVPAAKRSIMIAVDTEGTPFTWINRKATRK